MTHHIALYGKGGVGKTTLVTNISAALVEAGYGVMLVGCDPKGDSATLLNGGFPIPSVLDQIRNQTAIKLETVVHTGFKDIRCVELGDPTYSATCTSAEISKALKELNRLQVFEKINPDYVRSEEHTSELQSQFHLVCRLLLEKKK